jgi:hypothetical protein
MQNRRKTFGKYAEHLSTVVVLMFNTIIISLNKHCLNTNEVIENSVFRRVLQQ